MGGGASPQSGRLPRWHCKYTPENVSNRGLQRRGQSDKRLRNLSDSRIFVFELEATSEFDPSDSNRIVLTSSSEKLRRYFNPPINHLLATACYRKEGTQIHIHNLRLDYLEPSTPVNVRLEAFVSQRILAKGVHPNVTL